MSKTTEDKVKNAFWQFSDKLYELGFRISFGSVVLHDKATGKVHIVSNHDEKYGWNIRSVLPKQHK